MESLEKYKKVVDHLILKINGKFSNITFLTIDELLKDGINLKSVWWELAKIYDYNYSESKKVEKELEKLSEEDYDEWGYKFDDEASDLRGMVEWKIMSLQSLIDYLETMVDKADEESILTHFKDIKTIDI